MRNKLLATILVMSILLMSISLVSSATPINLFFTGENGLELQSPIPPYQKLEGGGTIAIHVFNKSNGVLISFPDASCKALLVGTNGSGIFSEHLDPHENHFHTFFNSTHLSKKGVYGFTIRCNTSEIGGYYTGYFEVTNTGNANEEGIVIIFFSLLFILICFEMLGLLLWTILHFLELNLDAKSLILNVSSYFALFAFYILQTRFLADEFISDFTLFLVQVGAVTTVIIPLIGFVVCYIKQNMKGDHN